MQSDDDGPSLLGARLVGVAVAIPFVVATYVLAESLWPGRGSLTGGILGITCYFIISAALAIRRQRKDR